MDFGHGDGSFGAGERSMANLLNELGGEHRQRNNSNNNNGGGGGGGGGVLSMSPANNNNNSNPLKPCRSVSEMDLSKSRDVDDHHSREVQGPMKLPRTDSFPFDLKSHHHHHQFQLQLQQHQNQNQLGRSNSIVSDGRLGYSPTNSSVSDPVSVLYAGDSTAAAAARTAHASLLQPFYPFKTAGLPALSMGRETASHMGMGTGMHAGGGVLQGSRICFTQSQWQELEHQALIFKYMLACVPVPPELLIPIRKSVGEMAGLSAGPGSHHPNMSSWGSFHLRFANNTDPEPGRCRRTDGKKWRCSRDVAPDQKYCERHMHRGRPRSRKPVEGGQTAINTSGNNNNTTAQSLVGGPSSSTPATTNNAASSMIGLAAGRSSTSSLTSLRPSISINNTQQNHNQSNSALMGIKPFSSSGTGGGLISINGVSGSSQFKPPLHMVSPVSAMPNKDYRCMNWMKGEIDEQILFSEANPGNNNTRALGQDSHSMNNLAMFSSVNNAWRLMPSKLADTKINSNTNTNSLLQYNSPQLRAMGQDFGLMPEMNLHQSQHHHQQQQQEQQQQQQQHSFVSNGFGVVESVRDQSSGGQPLRHFFDDWPRSRDPWSDMEAEQRPNPTNSSTTQLSISIPMTSSDFAGTNSNSPRGKISLSSLKLSMSMARGAEDDPTQMGLGVGMGLGPMNEERHHRQNTNNWIPVSWQSTMGGPLAEVLQSTTNGSNAAVTSRGCKTPGGLNLMTEGWDLSPHGSPRMASPTGVLQKTLASLSDSSGGSSPRAVAAAAAAKHDQTALQQNLGGV